MPYGRPFHISELVLRTEELQRQTTIVFDADEGRRVLEEVIPAGDEEARSILAAYWERVGYDRRVEAQVRWAERNGNATQRMEVVRQKLHRKLYGEAPADEGQEQPKREPDPDSVLITSCGARAGTAMVQRDDGKWTCPNCGALEGEGCATRKLDAEAAAE